jgi:hypothetical protein
MAASSPRERGRRVGPGQDPDVAALIRATYDTLAVEETIADVAMPFFILKKYSAATIAPVARPSAAETKGRRRAIDVVLDRRLFALDADRHDAFMHALDHPPAPGPKLSSWRRPRHGRSKRRGNLSALAPQSHDRQDALLAVARRQIVGRLSDLSAVGRRRKPNPPSILPPILQSADYAMLTRPTGFRPLRRKSVETPLPIAPKRD